MDILNWYQYPTVISTKGRLIVAPEYLSRLKDGKYAVQVSLISDDDKLVKAIEPGAPNATERLNMLDALAKAGLWTACRVQPLIPASPCEANLESLIKKLAGVGVKHVVVEGYKIPLHIPMENRKRIDEACGGKVEAEYRACGATQKGMEILLPDWRVWQYLEPARELIHKYGMTFGAGDNAFRDTGDVKCCCGIDNLPGYSC
jgi:DNA repair photolyase